MKIYPAIDIKNGKCVMLKQGNPDDETIYSDDPLEIAFEWEEKGAEFLHIVNLDGAIYGKDRGNFAIIEKIRQKLNIPIQVGGGIRDKEKISFLLDNIGVDRVIVGTLAIEDKNTLAQVAEKYPGRLAVSIDAKDGLVATRGWTRESSITAEKLCSEIKKIGIDTVIYTDISKDGMLKGPNIQYSKELIQKTGLDVIVSGGITNLDDIKSIKKIGAAGAIIGKALYSGKIDLRKAIQIAKEVS